MNLDKILGSLVVGLIGVAALTTVFGRRNSAAVINASGNAFANAVSASLGKGAGIS